MYKYVYTIVSKERDGKRNLKRTIDTQLQPLRVRSFIGSCGKFEATLHG